MVVEFSCSPAIFRIQKKSDFEEIGFGNAQYERPWLRFRIKKMGKKMGVVPKCTNLVAIHWGEKNKGYPEGFNSYHTYEPDREKRNN